MAYPDYVLDTCSYGTPYLLATLPDTGVLNIDVMEGMSGCKNIQSTLMKVLFSL